MKNNDTTNNDSSESSDNKGRSNNKRRNYNNAKKADNSNSVNEGNHNNPTNNNPQSRTSNKSNNPTKKSGGGTKYRSNGNRTASTGKAMAKNGNSHHNGSLSGHVKPTIFERFATRVSKAAGSTPAFTCALLIVVGWAVCGPFFNFSETWQLVINTGTTIITFLMVFLIQKAQNKDSLAIQLKLNELVASHAYSSNRLVDIENMTEEEMMVVQKYYRSLSELSKKDEKLQTSHSIEEAEQHHQRKSNQRSRRNKPGNFKSGNLE